MRGLRIEHVFTGKNAWKISNSGQNAGTSAHTMGEAKLRTGSDELAITFPQNQKMAQKRYGESVEQENASLCFARVAGNIKMACAIFAVILWSMRA